MRVPTIEKPVRVDQVEGYGYRLKNLLINPSFEVWQRGVSFVIPAGSGTYTADEWLSVQTVDTITISAASPVGRIGSYSARLQSVGLASPNILQGIENWKELEGLTLTLSVWVNCSQAGKTGISILDWNGLSGDAVGVFNTQAGVWERVTAVKTIRTGLSYPGAGAPPHGYPLWVSIGVLPGCDTYVDGASLVVGNFPEGVPFYPPNPQDELNRCMRYYQKYMSYQSGQYLPAGGSNVQSMPMSVPMAPGAVRNILAQTLNGNLSSASLVLDMNGSQSLKATVTDAGGGGGGGTVSWDFELKVP